MNLAVIPARAGSKGLVDKNIRPLGGKPLIQHTIDAAKESKLFDSIVVTTDSYRIASLCSSLCEVIIRPGKLGLDNVPVSPVVIHALLRTETKFKNTFKKIVTLQPTSPLRTGQQIKEAYDTLEYSRADSLLSVVEEPHSIWKLNGGYGEPIRFVTKNRQQVEPYYMGNGAIFITKRETLLEYDNRIGGKVALFPMNTISSVDIHTIKDLELAEWYLKRRVK